MWAWVRYSKEGQKENRIQKLDIDLYDDDGNLCVSMKGYSFRVLEGQFPVASIIKKMKTTKYLNYTR